MEITYVNQKRFTWSIDPCKAPMALAAWSEQSIEDGNPGRICLNRPVVAKGIPNVNFSKGSSDFDTTDRTFSRISREISDFFTASLRNRSVAATGSKAIPVEFTYENQ